GPRAPPRPAPRRAGAARARPRAQPRPRPRSPLGNDPWRDRRAGGAGPHPYKLRTLDEVALFLHLAGVVTLFAGMAVAAVGLAAARRRERAEEIALLLGLTRIGVVLVGAGLALAVACGFWLLDLTEFDLGDAW